MFLMISVCDGFSRAVQFPRQDECCTCFLLTILLAKQQQRCIQPMATWTFCVFHLKW